MVSLDLGCGLHKDADIGMDAYAVPGVDVVHNALDVPWPFSDASFDRVVSHQFLEHLPPTGSAGSDPLFTVFDEVWRILKPGGVFAFDVPHFKGDQAYNDPTHRRSIDDRYFTRFYTPDEYNPYYPRKMWVLKSFRIERSYGLRFFNEWHMKRHFPRLDRWCQRVGIGTKKFLFLELEKPRVPNSPTESEHVSEGPDPRSG